MEQPYQLYKEQILEHKDVEKTMEDAEEAYYMDGVLGHEQYGTLLALYREITHEDYEAQ